MLFIIVDLFKAALYENERFKDDLMFSRYYGIATVVFAFHDVCWLSVVS